MKRVNLLVPFAILGMTIGSTAFANDARNFQACNSKMIATLKNLEGLVAERYTQVQNPLNTTNLRAARTSLVSYRIFAHDGKRGNLLAEADCVVSNRRKKIVSFNLVSLSQKIDSNYALLD